MTRPPAALALLILAATALSGLARAEDEDGRKPMPETLVIGYEEEGKVDASEAACRAFVTDMVEWDPPEMEQAVKDVCAVRRRHVEAYAAFQAAYAKFRAALTQQIRFDGEAAARHLATLVKSCIDMKWELSTGGHNIGTDMVPNDIAAQCLAMARDILVKETARLGIDEPMPRVGR